MRVNVASITKVSGVEVGFDFQSWMRIEFGQEELRFLEPVVVRGKMENIGEDLILATGNVSALLERRCDRCLANFEEKIAFDFAERFSKKMAIGDADCDIYTFSGDVVDLTDMVRELLLLELPTVGLCRRECSGLCQRCGADLNYRKCNCDIERENAFASLALYGDEEE